MVIPNDNLVFIAYRAGQCGSLLYALISLSTEVQQYREFTDLEFNDGTAHEVEEHWIPSLHDYSDSLRFSPEKWNDYLTSDIQLALQNKKLIIVRCHPNTAYKLSFIDNVKVVYITTENKYKFERWAFEKVFKRKNEMYYINEFQKLAKCSSTPKITSRIKRHILIRNFNHDAKSYHECKEVLKIAPYNLSIDAILSQDYAEYSNLCKYLLITPISKDRFNNILKKYISKQWKRY